AISEQEGISIKYTGEYSLFSISETAALDSVLHYSRQYGIQGNILRIPPVYGYGPHTEIFKEGKPIKTGFKIFIEKALKGETIEVWGNPNNGRDIIYVKDVVNAMISALKSRQAKGIFNISSGRRLTLEEQVRTIAQVFSPSNILPKIQYIPEKENSIDSYFYDITKAKKELGWAPQYSFEQMLIDYRDEERKGRFEFLIKKRNKLLSGDMA
ncbi:MAG: NAD-dependent epimerase/dehydratase family protein, partial [Desulfobacula sp.]